MGQLPTQTGKVKVVVSKNGAEQVRQPLGVQVWQLDGQAVHAFDRLYWAEGHEFRQDELVCRM